MKNSLILALLLTIFTSCGDNRALFDTGDNAQASGGQTQPPTPPEPPPVQETISTIILPNPILDGQQTVATLKLSSPVDADRTIYWQIVDENGDLADDYFIAVEGSLVVPLGEDTAQVFMTSIPASVPTGEETFSFKISNSPLGPYQSVSGVKLEASSESTIVVDTVAISSLMNNAYANSANQSSYFIEGVCSAIGGNVAVSVFQGAESVSQNVSCDAGGVWDATLNLSSLTLEGTFTVRAYHSGPNVPSEAIRQMIRDVSAPSVTISLPAQDTYVGPSGQNAFSLSGSCSENSQGVSIVVTSSGGGGSASSSVLCSGLTWSTVLNVAGLLDGTLTATVDHADAAGNSNDDARTFVKNSVVPTIAITTPAPASVANSLNYNSQIVEGTCNKNGATIALTGDVGGNTSGTCNGATFQITGVEITGADGLKSLTATVTDEFSNEASSVISINKMTSLPTAVLSGTPINLSADATLNVTVAGTLVSHYRYKLGDNALDCLDPAGYSVGEIAVSQAIEDGLGADGSKKLCVVGIDSYGNPQPFATPTVYEWIKNSITPSILITSPIMASVANSLNYTSQVVEGTCNTSGASIALTGDVGGTVSGTCDGANFQITGVEITGADGFRSLTATMTDAFFRTATSVSFILKATALPTAVLTGRPGAVSNQENLNITVGGSLVTHYRYKLGDDTLDCSDDLASYSAERAISLPITDNLGADGDKKLCVVAIDTYGNPQPFASATDHEWLKNTAAPALSIDTPIANSYVNSTNVSSFEVTGTCGINAPNSVVIQGSLTTTYAHCVDGEWSQSLDFSAASEGPVFILASQEDPDTGNIGQDSRLFIKATILPNIAITAPNENSYINKANRAAFTVSGTCNFFSATPNIVVEGGTSNVNVACNGTTWEAELTFADEANGTPTVTATITDIAGNERESERDFILDTVAPTVAFAAPVTNYINIANQASFELEGSCSDAGTNNIVISENSVTLATINCTTGTPNWETTVNLSALTQGAKTLVATHTDAAGNSSTHNLNLTKDTVAPAVAWASPLENVCLSNATAGTFQVSGSCTDGDGNVTISSDQLATPVSAACSGSNEFSTTLNVDTAGLANGDSFAVEITQTDTAGNEHSESRDFKFINAAPTITFGGWEDVYAIGKKTYRDGNPDEDGVVRIKWKEWPSSNTCMPDAVKVFRSDDAGGSLAGTEVSDLGGIPSTVRVFEDEDLDELDFGKAWYYGLRVIIADHEIDVTTPAPIAEIRVMAPPNNMALVHRWITNQEVCGLMEKTSDEDNHYRCDYTGQGNVGGFHDMKHDLLVDRFQLGCNITETCGAGEDETCTSSHHLSIENPSTGGGVVGAIGSVYYHNATTTGSPGQCWYKFGAANTNWRALNNAATTLTQLAEATTSEAHAPPLVYVSRDKAYDACEQQIIDLSHVEEYADNTVNTVAAKRLLRQKEWRAAAAWDREMDFPEAYPNIDTYIGHLEHGTHMGSDTRVGKCNGTNNRHSNLSQGAREFLGGFEMHSMAFETGSKVATIDCQSRYGVQDMTGNVWEWTSDQLSCGVPMLGDTCVGVTSGKDTDNHDMVGFAFDGFQGPGDRRYSPVLDPTFTTDDWVFDQAARNGTTHFNPVLGLPLMSGIADGSVSIAAWSAANLFHGDRIWLSPTNGSASRGLRLGGSWSYGSIGGRWASIWDHAPTLTHGTIGGRCALPVK